MGLLVALSLLVVPLGHQIKSHRIHMKLVRAFWPGLAIPLTVHELKHAARPHSQQVLADMAWLAFIAMAVAVVLVIA